jgi:hypothetical protein
MNAIDIEKLNQLISRTDISGNDKVRWLTDFIDGRELQQQQCYSKEEEKFKECYFIASTKTSSATICENCGKEKFLHKI